MNGDRAFWLAVTSFGIILSTDFLSLIYDTTDWRELFMYYNTRIVIIDLSLFIAFKAAREGVERFSYKVVIDIMLAFIGGNLIDRILEINHVTINDLLIPIITLTLVGIKHRNPLKNHLSRWLMKIK